MPSRSGERRRAANGNPKLHRGPDPNSNPDPREFQRQLKLLHLQLEGERHAWDTDRLKLEALLQRYQLACGQELPPPGLRIMRRPPPARVVQRSEEKRAEAALAKKAAQDARLKAAAEAEMRAREARAVAEKRARAEATAKLKAEAEARRQAEEEAAAQEALAAATSAGADTVIEPIAIQEATDTAHPSSPEPTPERSDAESVLKMISRRRANTASDDGSEWSADVEQV